MNPIMSINHAGGDDAEEEEDGSSDMHVKAVVRNSEIRSTNNAVTHNGEHKRKREDA